MNTTIMVVWLLVGNNTVVMQYAVRFDTAEQCAAEVVKHQDKRTGFKRFPVKYAECLPEIKAK